MYRHKLKRERRKKKKKKKVGQMEVGSVRLRWAKKGRESHLLLVSYVRVPNHLSFFFFFFFAFFF